MTTVVRTYGVIGWGDTKTAAERRSGPAGYGTRAGGGSCGIDEGLAGLGMYWYGLCV